MLPILLIFVIGSAVAMPPRPDTRPPSPRDRETTLPVAARNRSDAAADDGSTRRPSETAADSAAERKTTTTTTATAAAQGRKYKAVFVDYHHPPISPYPRPPAYEIDRGERAPEGVAGAADGSRRYQDSNIFYIRLPPTPYMFVPGLGYVSQPPTYSTATAVGLNPAMAIPVAHAELSQLLQPPIYAARPGRPPSTAAQQQKPANPFIKLPVDFVSNGKPTSVYQWRKKPGKKPADSPITNLDNLSADFVSNGKPTSIYQWQASLKPAKRPDGSLNSLDMGPYTFNGKLTSLYLLGSDGTSSMRQSISFSDYRDDYRYAYTH